jgi:hypothetical protein
MENLGVHGRLLGGETGSFGQTVEKLCRSKQPTIAGFLHLLATLLPRAKLRFQRSKAGLQGALMASQDLGV